MTESEIASSLNLPPGARFRPLTETETEALVGVDLLAALATTTGTPN